MPRKPSGARLYCRPDTAIWIIRDTGCPDRSTGTRDRREAEAVLAAYIAQRGRPSGGPALPEAMTISTALALYGEEHAPHVVDQARIGYAIEALDRFWGDLPVSAITRATCRRYGDQRRRAARRDPETGEVLEWLPVSPGTIRKELGTLKAALGHAVREGHLVSAPHVFLPPEPAPRDRWLTRQEAAQLLRAARRNAKARHLARFILLGLYTGTRKEVILGLQWRPNTTGGWIDTEAGLMFRRAEGTGETRKRRPTARLPRQLLAHARRWEREGGRWVVGFKGARVASIRTAWATAAAEAGISGATPHTLRHTAITWAMQRGARLADVAGFFGVSIEVLERTYWHHHPDFQESAVEAMESRVSVRPHSFKAAGTKSKRTNQGGKPE